jgi:hypothetical protein
MGQYPGAPFGGIAETACGHSWHRIGAVQQAIDDEWLEY